MKNLVLIGDVHSQYSKFSRAVKWIENNVENYHIIQGGDLFDSRTTESDSASVYELMKSLGDKITVLHSNHLWKLFRWSQNPEIGTTDCMKRTITDLTEAGISFDEVNSWLKTLPYGIAFKDSNNQEYRACHAFWNRKIYVPHSYDGLYKIQDVTRKSRDYMLYGLKRKVGDDSRESVRWWKEKADHEYIRVSFHYHTISVDPTGRTGNKHIILDGSCGSDNGELPVYVVNNNHLILF